jgi:hypothetical protein
VGALVAVFVVLRAQDALEPPIAVFLVAVVAFVEVTLSVRR